MNYYLCTNFKKISIKKLYEKFSIKIYTFKFEKKNFNKKLYKNILNNFDLYK